MLKGLPRCRLAFPGAMSQGSWCHRLRLLLAELRVACDRVNSRHVLPPGLGSGSLRSDAGRRGVVSGGSPSGSCTTSSSLVFMWPTGRGGVPRPLYKGANPVCEGSTV